MRKPFTDMKAHWLLGLQLAALSMGGEPTLRPAGTHADLPLLAGLTEFIYWPGAAAPQQRLIVGMVGYAEPAQISLLEAVSGRRLELRPVSLVSQMRGCHVVLFGRLAAEHMEGYLLALKGEPVLTAAAIPGFARMGGMVELSGAPHGRRFLVNLAAARLAGFRMRPGLISVAELLPRE